MAESDAEAPVGWPGGFRSPLLHAGAVPFVVAPPWTPRQEFFLETHRSLILAGSVSLEMLAMDPLTDPTVATKTRRRGN